MSKPRYVHHQACCIPSKYSTLNRENRDRPTNGHAIQFTTEHGRSAESVSSVPIQISNATIRCVIPNRNSVPQNSQTMLQWRIDKSKKKKDLTVNSFQVRVLTSDKLSHHF